MVKEGRVHRRGGCTGGCTGGEHSQEGRVHRRGVFTGGEGAQEGSVHRRGVHRRGTFTGGEGAQAMLWLCGQYRYLANIANISNSRSAYWCNPN